MGGAYGCMNDFPLMAEDILFPTGTLTAVRRMKLMKNCGLCEKF